MFLQCVSSNWTSTWLFGLPQGLCVLHPSWVLPWSKTKHPKHSRPKQLRKLVSFQMCHSAVVAMSERGVGGKGKQHRNQGGRKHLPEPKIQPEYVGSLRCQICYVTRGCLPCAGMHTVLEGGGGRPGEKRSTPEWLPETWWCPHKQLCHIRRTGFTYSLLNNPPHPLSPAAKQNLSCFLGALMRYS